MICGLTGASGVLGKKISKYLPFKFNFFKRDITKYSDVNRWIKSKDFHLIIHLAAIVPTKLVNEDCTNAYNVNVIGTKNLIKSIKNKNKKPNWFFFSSTSHVYKVCNKYKKISENSKTQPSTLYGKTKLIAEKNLKKNFNNSKPLLCIGRIFSFTDDLQIKPFVIPEITHKIKTTKTKIVNLKNLNHFRDFITTRDIADIIYKLYKLGKRGTFNIGSGKKVNLKEISLSIGKKLKKKIIFTSKEKPTFLIANNNKISKIYKKN